MTRHCISAVNPDHTIIVGWDNPLRTFFATIHDKTVAEDEEDLILSFGDDYDEIQTVEELQSQLKEYAVISDGMIAQLNQDKADGAGFISSRLQQWVEGLAKATMPQPTSTSTVEVVKCQINWWLGWANSPSLQIWVKQVPDWSQMPHQKHFLGKGMHQGQECWKYLYYAEVDGFVHKLHGNPTVNESGYSSSEFSVLLEDGTTEIVKGPWDSAWSPNLTVPPYYSITILREEQQGGGLAGYITEAKLKSLVEQFCPEAELVPDPLWSSQGIGRLRIKRREQSLDCEHHGALSLSQSKYRGLTIKVFRVPETGESIAELWEPGRQFRSRTTSARQSPELAIQEAYVQANRLRPVAVADEEL